jgi:hypothetical protein
MTIIHGDILILRFQLVDDGGYIIGDLSGYNISVALERNGVAVKTWAGANMVFEEGGFLCYIPKSDTPNLATGSYDVKLQVNGQAATAVAVITVEEEEQ